MPIATLSIDIEARLANLEASFSRATQVAEKNAKRMSEVFDRVSASMASIGVGLSAGAFAIMVKSVSDAGDQLAKLSDKTGIAVENLSKLQYAASLSDVSTDDLQAALTRLNRVMGDAANGSKEAQEALARFGIDPKQMTTIQAFEQIADRVKATGDKTKAASALNDVFGRSYATLLPLLKGGAEGLKEAGDELERLGGVMSGELARKSEEFNDNLTRINKSLEALRIESMAPVISGLESLTSKFVEATKAAGGFWKGLLAWGVTSGSAEDDPGAAIAELSKKLATLKEQKEGLEKTNYFGIYNKDDLAINSTQIKAMSLKLEYLKGLNTRDAGSYTDRWMPGATTSPEITDSPIKNSTVKTGKKTKVDDPLGTLIDDLQPKIRAYESMMESFQKMNLDASVSSADLTNAEKKFLEIINSSEWGTLGADMQERVRAQFELANETERAANETERLNSLIGATPTEKWKAFASDVEFLQKALEDGRIKVEQYEEAIRALSDKNTEKLNEQKDAAKELGMTFTSAFEDAIVEGNKFSQVLDGLYKDILRILVRKNMTEPLTNSIGSFDWSSLFSFNALGNVYSSPGLSAYSGRIVSHPTVFPFAKGIGLMGEAGSEAILPLKRGSSGKLGVEASVGAPQISIVVNNTASDTTSADVRTRQNPNNGLVEVEVLIQKVLASDLSRNGPVARGFAGTFGLSRSA